MVPAGCALADAEPVIRVALVRDAATLTIDIAGACRIVEEPPRNPPLSLRTGLHATVRRSPEGFRVDKRRYSCRSLSFEPEAGQTVRINARPYRGRVKLVYGTALTVTAVNYLPIEDYVKGVSVRETSHYWPAEALQAQAVVFRSFALWRMQESRRADFDVTGDVSSQVYGGRAAERYRIIEAVDRTRGRVLTFRGRLIPAFFHSTCAGFTEDAARLWKIRLEPLEGVRCGFCNDSPHFSWQARFPGRRLLAQVRKQYPRIRDIRDLEVSKPDRSGRRISVTVLSDQGPVTIAAKDFRMLIGPDAIRSTNFTVTRHQDDFIFKGRGWGHGVGLCQWGAYGMAKAGILYAAILSAYYPHARIETRYP